MAGIRPVARLSGTVLILGGVAGLTAGLLAPWVWDLYADDDGRPGRPALIAIVVLAPAVSLLPVLPLRGGTARGTAAKAAAAAALAAGVIAAVGLLQAGPDRGLRLGGPLTVLGCVGLAAGWALVAAAGWGPLRFTVAPVAVTCAGALVIGLAAPPAIEWYIDDRFVRHGTAAPLPAVAGGPPVRVDRVGWQTGVAGADLRDPAAQVSGRHLLVPVPEGVSALDAVTGRPRWSYRRTDTDDGRDIVLTSGGRITVIVYRIGLMVALDTATGRLLWERRSPDGFYHGHPGDGDGILISGGHRGRVVSLIRVDGRTGEPAWTWTTRVPGACGSIGYIDHAIAADAVTALVISCNEADDQVIGLSSADGRRLWSRSATVMGSLLPYVPLRRVGGGIWVDEWSGEQMKTVVLDPRNGTPRYEHKPPDGIRSQENVYDRPLAAGGLAVYVDRRAIAVDPATGRVRWTSRIPRLTGWVKRAALAGDGTAYLLLAPGRETGDVQVVNPPLRLVAIDTADGRVTADHTYAPSGCAGCRPRLALTPGPGLLIISEVTHEGQTRLRAVG